MAGNEDDVTVVLDAEPHEGAVKVTDEQVVKIEAKPVERKAPVDDAVEQFKATADRERERRIAAERREATERERGQQLGRDVVAAREEVSEREFDSITAGLAAAQVESSAAETEYKVAFDAGDGAAMATAQRKLARAEAKSVRLDEAKAELEARRATKAEGREGRVERQPKQRQVVSSDPIDAYVAGRTEPTANWLRAHPEWITDPRKNAKLTSAHYSAQAEGIATDTDEYFEHVETFIGLKQAAGESKPNGAAANGAAKPRARTPAVAPGSHAGGAGNGGGNEVRLTKGEATAATDGTHVWNYDDPSPQKRFRKGDPIGVQEFARRKLELTKQGAYDRSYVEQ